VIEHRDEEGPLPPIAPPDANSAVVARSGEDEELLRARDELAKHSELLRVTLASIGDGVVTTDPEGRVLTLNKVAQGLTGWTEDEARGRPVSEILRLVDEDTRATVENPAVRALREGKIVGLANHTLLVARDGQETPIDDSAAPIRDEQGRVHGAVVVFRSVAERRHAERERHRLAAIVDSSQDAIVSKTLDSVVRSWNAAAEEMFGYSAAEMIGEPITRLIPPERVEEEEMILARLRRGERVEHYETVRVRKDGRLIDVSLTISPIRDGYGRIVGASKIARDITERKRADAALRESEQRFRLLADTVPAIIWTAAPDGAITWANDRWSEFAGAKLEESGRRWPELVLHPDDRTRWLAAWTRALRDGTPLEIELRLRRYDGVHRWCVTRAVPLRDGSGRIAQWVGTTNDIDHRKRAEETTRFLAEASAALASLTDPESTLQQVASLSVPQFADWCAVDVLEIDGTVRRMAVAHADPTRRDLVRELERRYPPSANARRGFLQAVRTGESEWAATIPDDLLAGLAEDEEHLRILRGVGLRSYVSVPLKSRLRVLGAMTFAIAGSGRVYEPNDVRAAEDLASRTVIAMENANLLATLREADRRKDEFLAMLAHELRNPLAPIRNAAQILRLQGSSGQDLLWSADVIERQVHQMTRLVDDLLDVSRITRGKIELRKEAVELASVVRSAVEASRPLIEKWEHQLTVVVPPEPIRLEADATRLAQVLSNILTNAAKYTDQGGHIRLAVERLGDEVLVRVKDDGIGIPKDALPRIFDMFTQLPGSLDRSEGGLGIGLTLVRRLVELHGGAVEARSEGPGKGSEFIVRLPIARDAARLREPSVGDLTGVAPRRILVVDDNRDAAESLGMLLEMIGNEVRLAHDGLEAVTAAAEFRPDVVLLDLGLPKLNGYEAARAIREGTGGDGVLLVALTGWGQEEDRRRSRAAGFDHHLTKPVDFEALRKLLASVDAAAEPRRPSAAAPGFPELGSP
jgi:PAS domain S-box-containing protein